MSWGGAFGFFEDVGDGRDAAEAANGEMGQLKNGHGGEEAHALAITLEQVGGGFARFGVAGFGGLAGEEDAGSEPLEVPLEGAADGFVEVVDVEDEFGVDTGVGAEIADVGVAAELGDDAGIGLEGEVIGHDRHGSAKEAEGRGGHEPVAEIEQARKTAVHGTAEQIQRIVTAELRIPVAMLRAGELFAAALAGGAAIGRRESGGHRVMVRGS